MVLAVAERRAQVTLSGADIFTATVGGVKLTEPASDLAVALAVASAAADRPLPAGLVAIGEVGLAGEVRGVDGVERRLAEASRLGFRRALVPTGSGRLPQGIDATEVTDLREAIARAFQAAVIPLKRR